MKFDLDIIKPLLQSGSGYYQASYNRLNLHSVFQPILNIHSYEIIGYEGLMRGYTEEGKPVGVDAYFNMARSLTKTVAIDRLLRTLHVANFTRQANSEHKLFLNVCPRVVIEGHRFGAFFARMLDNYQLSPERIVIEIVEKAIHDEEALSFAVDYYRDMGCQVAIDDFGRGYSNLSRIWTVRPNIVKLDRQLLHYALQQNNAEAMLGGVVDMLHESECQVIAEGIENRAQADMAFAAGVDLVQGFYYQEPMSRITPEYRSQLMPVIASNS